MENRFELGLVEKNSLILKRVFSINSELESILQNYWPNNGQDFYKKIVESDEGSQICYSLVQNSQSGKNQRIIGFARLRPGVQRCKTSGRVGVLSYVIVSKEERGNGFGKFLMGLV